MTNQTLQGEQIFELTTGVKVKRRKMSTILIYDVQKQIPLPKPPMVKIKQGGKDLWVENASDPGYQERMDDALRDRNMAAMDCMIRMGIDLVSPLPENLDWLQALYAVLDLSKFEDAEGEISLENLKYLYLRYVAIFDPKDFNLISTIVTPTEEGVAEAAEQFQPDA